MRATFKSLPEDPTELRAVSALMAAEIKTQAYQIEKLKKELAAHRKARFCSKSEAMDQLAFDLQEDTEIAAASEAQKTASETDADQDAPTKRTHNRAPLPDHLERQEEILSPGDACGDCGGALKPLGEDVTEELEYVPGHFVVKRIVRPRMTCICCEAFAQAELPSRPITRGRPGPGLLAHVLVGKYCDHLPLYRQSEIYARDKVDLHRSTLRDWVGRSTALLEPLAAHIGKLVRASPPSTPWKKKRAIGPLMRVLPCDRIRQSRSLTIWRHGSRCSCPKSPENRRWQQPSAMRSVACQRRGPILKTASWSWTTISASDQSDR